MNIKKHLPKAVFFLFFTFICYIIYAADTNNGFWLMKVAEKIKYGDKIGHLVLYGLLGMFLNIALKNRMIHNTKLPLGSVIVLIFAIAEEFTQLAFETRTFDYIDMLCDVIGLGIFSPNLVENLKKSMSRLTS
ncbi:VanZ family protein [Marinoscillum pacificum]|uniref:VanZ family protein n=1 Tax=Marinoscillum pacificum TaxID=392723 RepID=UPI002157518D|nr:VanZ family protein [Marinoscillum pacificum]